MTRVLWVTNDLPPRAGGIERFVGELLRRVHPRSTVVLGPPGPADSGAHDAGVPYEVRRLAHPLRPDPRTARAVAAACADVRPDVVVLGAAWPLAELVPAIRRVVAAPIVGISHGLEAGIARTVLRPVLRRTLGRLDAVTTISVFTEAALAPALAGVRTLRLPPGVDPERFARPGDVAGLRTRWGVPAGAPVVGLVSRLVARKGQDVLVRAWPAVRSRVGSAHLVLAGEGPLAGSLQRAARRLGPVGSSVHLVGRLDDDELATAYAAFDVVALPCRTRWGGLDVEGLGIVTLEAQAAGRPVVVGRSGGAPEALAGDVTGTVVDGHDADAVAAALVRWLSDPTARRRAAELGPTWVRERWTWDAIAARFAALIDELAPPA